MANSVKDELSHELKVQELQENLRKAEQMGMEDLSPELKSSVEELKKAAQSVNRPYADKAQSETEPAKAEPVTESAEKVEEIKVSAADKKAE